MTPAQLSMIATRLELASQTVIEPYAQPLDVLAEAAEALRGEVERLEEILAICDDEPDARAALMLIEAMVQR